MVPIKETILAKKISNNIFIFKIIPHFHIILFLEMGNYSLIYIFT